MSQRSAIISLADSAGCSTQQLVEHVTSASGHPPSPTSDHKAVRGEVAECDPDRYRFPDRLEDARASCSGRCAQRTGAASGGRSPTAGGPTGLSGSICTQVKGGCGASCGEASYLVNQSDLRSDTLSPRAATAGPAPMSASRKAEGRLRRPAQDPGLHSASYGAARPVRADEADLESRDSRSGANRSAELL